MGDFSFERCESHSASLHKLMKSVANLFAVLALVLAATTAFFWDDLVALYYNKTAKPISIADKICAPLWVARAQNDPALQCYLTQKVERFCNEQEREHLIWTLREYRNESANFNADLALALVSVQLGYYAEQATDPKKDAIQALSQSQAKVAKRLQANGVAKAMKVDHISRRKLAANVQSLAEKGLIQLSDFGQWPDSLIVDGFKGLKAVRSTCGSS